MKVSTRVRRVFKEFKEVNARTSISYARVKDVNTGLCDATGGASCGFLWEETLSVFPSGRVVQYCACSACCERG